MKHSLALALATSIFAIPAAIASDKIGQVETCIPEGYKGFRKEILKDKKQLETAQKKVSQLFIQELIEVGTILEQAKEHFYDDILEGDQEAIKAAKAFNTYFKIKLDKLGYLRDLYEGHKGVNVPQFDFEMQDKPPAGVGKHYLLTQEIIKIDSQLEDLRKQKEEAEKACQPEEKEKEKEEVEKAYQPEEKEKEIDAEISKLQSKREELSFQADLYALTKFIIYRNFYDSLPNNENSENGFYGVIPPSQEHLLLQLMNTQKEKHKILAEGMCAHLIHYYTTNQDLLRIRKGMGFDIYNLILTSLTRTTIAHKKRISEAFSEPYVSTSEFINHDHRADLLLRKRTDTWKARVLIQPGSIIDRFGLMSCLYNEAFDATSQRMMFSFANLDKDSGTLEKNLEELNGTDRRKAYEMGLSQLKFNFTWDAPTAASIIKPIAALLTRKLEMNKQQSRYKSFTASPDGEALAAQYALAKFASYQVMSYALTHSPTGEALSELSLVSEGGEPLMQAPEAFLRIDHVFRAKAYKWGKRLKESHPDFLEANGLTATYF